MCVCVCFLFSLQDILSLLLQNYNSDSSPGAISILPCSPGTENPFAISHGRLLSSIFWKIWDKLAFPSWFTGKPGGFGAVASRTWQSTPRQMCPGCHPRQAPHTSPSTLFPHVLEGEPKLLQGVWKIQIQLQGRYRPTDRLGEKPLLLF